MRHPPQKVFLYNDFLSIKTKATSHGTGNGYPPGTPTFLPPTILADASLNFDPFMAIPLSYLIFSYKNLAFVNHNHYRRGVERYFSIIEDILN